MDLPEAAAINTLFSALIGRPVVVKRIVKPAVPRTAMVVAVYARDDESRVGIIWLDLAAAASAAGGLALLGAKQIDDSVRAGRLLEPLDEHVREVLNVCGRFFSSPGSSRVSLHAVHLPPSKLPADLAALIGRPPATVQVDITITGYLSGKMGLIAG